MAIDNQVVNSEAKTRWIEMVQRQLIRENPSALPNYGVDGSYGPETTDWVQRFQERKGIQVDGVAGPATLSRFRDDIVQRPNTSGRGIEILQEDLLFFYIQQSAVDGNYGPGTTQGVRDFQFLNNLVVDGTAGPSTLKAMDELLTTLAVRRGDTGSLVRRIQNQLNDQDEVDISIDVDGSFGPATESAVREFQEAYDQNVDGIAGPVTMNLLDLEAYHPLQSGEILEYMDQFGFSADGEEVTNEDDIQHFISEVESHPIVSDLLPTSSPNIEDATILNYDVSGEVFYTADFGIEGETTIHVYAVFNSEKELDVITVLNIEGDLYEDEATLTAYDVEGDIIQDQTQTLLEFTNDSLNVQKEITELISQVSEVTVYDLSWNDVSCFVRKQIISEVVCTGLPWALGITLPTGIAGLVIGISCNLAMDEIADIVLEDECG
ncbi:peptidoglycan-binding protein [Shouchella sp. 1P09AA]|uniref:peptidoglycan-binding domain-containing protein n=1 Tax=unclassified Shouchella TaxID=2893065 RepID=UPI0039A386A5